MHILDTAVDFNWTLLHVVHPCDLWRKSINWFLAKRIFIREYPCRNHHLRLPHMISHKTACPFSFRVMDTIVTNNGRSFQLHFCIQFDLSNRDAVVRKRKINKFTEHLELSMMMMGDSKRKFTDLNATFKKRFMGNLIQNVSDRIS